MLDSDDKVVGILSDRDLRNAVVIYKDPDSGVEDFFASEDTPVDKIMVANPISVRPDDEILPSARLMREHSSGCLVVAENERLIGILSYIKICSICC